MANVVLSNGTNVKISSVLFNKEQRVNVPKTYVTTTKKAVTRVSDKFYRVAEKVGEDLFKTLPVAEPAPIEAAMPDLNAVKEEPVVEPVPTEPELELPKDLLEPEVKEEAPVVAPIPEFDLPKPEPVVPESVVPEPVVEVPVTPEPAPLPVQPVSAQTEVKTPEPVVAEPVVPAPIPEVSAPEPEAPKSNLFFDGANEVNLNKALDEVSEEKVVAAPQEGVEALREFGTDEPVKAEPEAPVEPQEGGNKGFATNKFLMVIAILFFLAACVFLGYEAFQYFHLQ